MRVIILLLIAIFISINSVLGQNEKVRLYLKMAALGQVNEVKNQIPDLLAEYPDDPGVKMLHAVVIDDAQLAIRKYEEILRLFPDSEWADDSYWRIVQYYAIIGEVAKAERELVNYRQKYPSSEFLSAASDIIKFAKSARPAIDNSNSNTLNNLNYDNQDDEQHNDRPKITVSTKKDTKKSDISKDSQSNNEILNSDYETDEPSSDNSESSDAISTGKYGLQVGIFSNYDAANNEKEKYKKLRMLAIIKEKVVDGKSMYAVIIGDYATRDNAETAKTIVQQQCKCNPYIYKK